MKLIETLTIQERTTLAIQMDARPADIEAVRHVSGAVLVTNNGERGPVFASETKMREVLNVRA